eukprot:SAG22_NODE_628_length_8398_cov_6.714905_1_plen_240_part_00
MHVAVAAVLLSLPLLAVAAAPAPQAAAAAAAAAAVAAAPPRGNDDAGRLDGDDAGGSGFMGITTDEYGFYHSPPGGLSALHSDPEFLRGHSLKAGGRPVSLGALSRFNNSMHIQLGLMRSNVSAHFALTLSLLGGASQVRVGWVAPPPGEGCLAQKIVNNTVASFRPWTAGPPTWWSRSWASWSMPEPFGTGVGLTNSRWTNRGANYTGSPEWCRALCCANRLCSGWTFTDPQFTDPGK